MPSSSSAGPSLRRAASKFRLKKDRDDFNPGFDTARIFVPSPLMHGGDIGIAGAACVVLMGYAVRVVSEGRISVVPQADSKIVGRMVDLHPLELARLDQVAEHAGDWHRFLAEAVGPQSGSKFAVWVYQDRTDATAVELSSSATELPAPTKAHLKLLKVS